MVKNKKMLLIISIIIFAIFFIPTKSNANKVSIVGEKNGYVKSQEFYVKVSSSDYKFVVLWNCRTGEKIKSWVNPSKNKDGYYNSLWSVNSSGNKKVKVSSDGCYRIAIYNGKQYLRNLKLDGSSNSEGRLTRVTFTVDTKSPKYVVKQGSTTLSEKEYFDKSYIATGNVSINISDAGLKEVTYKRYGQSQVHKVSVNNHKASFTLKTKGEYIVTAKDKAGHTRKKKIRVISKQPYNFKSTYAKSDGYKDEDLIARIIEHEMCISDNIKYYGMSKSKASRAGLAVGYCVVNRALNNHYNINKSATTGTSNIAKQLFYKRQYVSLSELSNQKYNPCSDCKKAASIIAKYDSTFLVNPKGVVMSHKVSDQSSFSKGENYTSETKIWWKIYKGKSGENPECICYCNCGKC